MSPSSAIPTVTCVGVVSVVARRIVPDPAAAWTSGRVSSVTGGATASRFRGIWDRRAWWGVAAAVLLSLILRIPFVSTPTYPDEGGYLLAAQHWRSGGSTLYGQYFVDRPPLLMAFWRAADALGGVEAARWLACLLVAILVVCAGYAGHLLGGGGGALRSSFTAAALASGPVLGAHEVDGELLAVPLVMLSCALALATVRSHDAVSQAWKAALLGIAAACAVLVKQNFVEALVFAAVLVIASNRGASLPGRATLRVLGCAFSGALSVVALTLAWAATTAPGPSGLWYAMYGFRSDAAQVIFSHSLDAPLARLNMLVGAAAVSGVLALIIICVLSSWSRMRRRDPTAMAIAAMLMVELAGVGLGGSYWVHYLVGLVPALALAAGTLGGGVALHLRRVSLVVIGFVVASAMTATAVVIGSTSSTELKNAALERVLQTASHPDDTLEITYGHANVIQGSGLRPGYPYLWSLPMRTLDPRLRLLVESLRGPSAPTWIVQWDEFNSWHIDANARLAATVRANYRRVDTVCGVNVYLHVGVVRSVPTSSGACPQ
jgi:hypothetical protein